MPKTPADRHRWLMILGPIVFMACGPGEPDVYEPPAELTAAEVCEARCEVRATCEPDATDPDAAGCFDVCMSLIAITEDSPCGVAQREVQTCIGVLDCEGYEFTMTPVIDKDPCIDAKLAFADLQCGARETPP